MTTGRINQVTTLTPPKIPCEGELEGLQPPGLEGDGSMKHRTG
jgi:hypothetical protein